MALKKTKRKDFKFYRSYYDVFNELDKDKDKLEFITAVLDKQFLGVEPDLKGIVRFAYISQEYSISKQVKGWQDATNQELTGAYTDPSRGCVVDPSMQLEVEVEVKEQYIDFDLFWSLYPKKVDKKKSKLKWDKLSNDVRKEILEYIPKYSASQPDLQFIKNPSTFLNNESWNDEIIQRDKSTEPKQNKIPTYGY